MIGHDVHSIVAGSGHADAIISVLESYIQKNVDLILTSHYVVENLEEYWGYWCRQIYVNRYIAD